MNRAGAFYCAGPVAFSQTLFVEESTYLILILTVLVTYSVALQFAVALIRTWYLSV